ncbi:hypothetical protein LZQ00_03135 [Sphingobacterium sp. SRCM116780]|uniref:hypothetical protein n=1 Tax=Sphingobacterium sp. SRCM116780 TaxID=2907623 RepID=UPI001F27B414|nr:hypothetical protein [Sphingobacterium sp. SRCM116780]UIR56819.1 hypothetical protein LZQ00_03135 [Sphingobacterium sp. SRCM116780]
MRIVLFIPLIFVLLSCQNQDKKTSIVHRMPSGIVQDTTNIAKDTLAMIYDSIAFSGKLGWVFSKSEFDAVFGPTIDSSISVFDDPPCNGGAFGEPNVPTDSLDHWKKNCLYLYQNESKFEQRFDSVAVENFRFSGTSFIRYKGHILNKETTVDDFAKLFPHVPIDLSDMDVYQEGTLQVLNIPTGMPLDDGHIKIFFKNGHLYMMHYWSPC